MIAVSAEGRAPASIVPSDIAVFAVSESHVKYALTTMSLPIFALVFRLSVTPLAGVIETVLLFCLDFYAATTGMVTKIHALFAEIGTFATMSPLFNQ